MINAPFAASTEIPLESAIPTSIVPQGQSRMTALILVIAIMSFLASLSLGGVGLIVGAAQDWRGQIAREATIQISPADGVDMEQSLEKARTLVASYPGIADAYILDIAATQAMLEPWLGSSFEIEDTMLPRLIIVRFGDDGRPDIDLIRKTVEQEVAGASFDDHHLWIGRLASTAQTLVIASLGVFILVVISMTLSVVFATRATLLTHANIIEVLHFIGADSRFVARQFDNYFLKIGFKGAVIGVGLTIGVFWLIRMNVSSMMATAEGYQFALLFGAFSLKISIMVALGGLVVFIALLTLFTSRSTVIRQLHEIDRRQNSF